MGDIHRINRGKPRKLGEVRWTDRGLRLPAIKRAVQSDWFWPAMLTLPLGAFILVFFW